MKKIGFICATLLAGFSLSACSNLTSHQSKSSKMSSLKAEHSSLVAESKKQAKELHKKAHKHKSTDKSTKTSQSSVSSINRSQNSSTQNNNQSLSNSNNNQSTGVSSHKNSTGNTYDNDNYNGDTSRYRNGTRKPSTFSNNQDYQAYLAYEQGYNYDKSTGQMTPMNDQQLNDMRQQMNKDGGQSFGQ